MDEVIDTKVHEYSAEVTVEVIGTDSKGEFAIVSYHFDRDDDGTTVQRREDIEPLHESDVENARERRIRTKMKHNLFSFGKYDV